MLPDEEERLRMRQPPHALPLMRQRWERLGFLHWRVDAAEIAAHLPPGLDVDTFDGDAYVGLVPFTIRGARPLLLPGVPGLSSFHELNFRTYVHRAGRDPGVWFFSLDAASRIVAALARRSYRLPYHHARMAMVEGGGAVSFRSQRTDGSPATFACTYAPEGRAVPAAVGSLPFFLVERYLLYSWDGRRLHTARVWHRSYPLQAARVTDLDEDLTAEAGFHTDGGAPLGHYCHELDVQIHAPRRAPLLQV
jgi:uncharacterized protein YqjF (DUF2071 family)